MVFSVFLKLPQIIKILYHKNALGIHVNTFFFESAANLPIVFFNLRHVLYIYIAYHCSRDIHSPLMESPLWSFFKTLFYRFSFICISTISPSNHSSYSQEEYASKSAFYRNLILTFVLYPTLLFFTPSFISFFFSILKESFILYLFNYMPLLSTVCIMMGRIPQIRKNYQQKHTGQV